MTSVLIIDDELDIGETFRAFLEKEGHDVTIVADFSEAESALTGQPYDVVVADVKPHVNGMALLRLAREIDEDIPVILVTGEAGGPSATEAVQRGAYDCVAKPVTQEGLIRMVGRAAEKKRLLDEKRRLEADNRAYRTDLERKVAARTAELEHRNQELAALIEIGRDTSATLDSTEVLKRVTQRAAQVCEAHRCTILLLSKDGKVATPLMSQFSDGHGEWKMWRMFKDTSYPVPVSQVSEAQRVIRERQPLFIPDASASSLPKLLIEPFGVKSVLLVPLISKERVVALMALDRVDVDQEFTSEQVNLAMAIAVQAMVAIENARLFEAERAQLLLARTLQEVGALLTTRLSLDEVCQHVFDLLSRVIKYDSVSLQLLGQDNQLSLLVERGFPDPELFSQVARELSDHVLENFAERKVIVIPDTHNNSRWIVVPELDYIRSWIGAPLLVKGKLIGILNVDSATVNVYDAALGETVMAFANQAAIAIENARLFDEEMSSRRLADTLRQVAQALNSILSLDDVLGLILTELEKVIPLDSGSIMLLEGKDLIVRSVKGFADPDSVLKARLDLDTAFLNREVVESKRPLIVGSVHEDKRWINALKFSGLEPELHDTCSWMGIPLNVKGQVIGMLTTDKREAHFYSERDAQVALTFANQAATAIENARLFGAEQRRRQEAETLCRAAQALATATLDLSQVFERILGELQQVVPYDSATVQLLKGDRLEIIGGRGFPNLQELLGVSFDLSREDNPNREVIRRRVSFIVDDVPAVYSNFRRGPHAAAGIRAWLGVPLLFGDRLIGMLALDKREIGFYTAEHARLAEAFAAQAAIAIENALLFEEAQRELTERKRAEAAFQERAASLELVARVAQRTTAILELDELLHQAVDLISDAFGYYNVVILLVEGDEVVSKAVTLPAAQAMEDRLRLRVGKDGITGWVAGSGEPLLVPDVSVDPRYYAATEGIKTKSELAVPIKLKGIVIGVLDVQSAELDAFSQADVFMLETVADQLAVAIGNARLFHDTTRRLNDLSLLHDVALIGAATLDFDQILRRTVESVRNELQLDVFGFLLIDEEAKVARLHP
ncbi:MAG: GAF domain-containing protein, partial [Chloroflexi bacterium]|nr:GAF domain-containing protein [Chloroflexota bacterium]